MADRVVTIEGKKLKLSNLDKVLYPATGFTKAHVIDYYRKVAKYMLPHLQDRPVTLKRFPEGVEGDFFYEKECPYYRPDWVETAGSESMKKNFCVVNDLATLIWIENLASIELHTLLAKAEDPATPTMIAFDLDPGPPAELYDCLEIALTMRDMLEGLGLESFPKTSGGKGLHFYVPLNTPVTYDQTKQFAKTVAQTMERHYPDRVVSKMSKQLRQGKVFIDWSQNTQHKTTVTVYSLRARARPTVSMPVTWEEVERAHNEHEPESLIYTAEKAVDRLAERGDIFKPVLTLPQHLPAKNGGSKGMAGTASKNGDKLEKYRQKRHFDKTPEPGAQVQTIRPAEGSLFVIQKHAATRLHYDVRLEVEGVLKSWAVPKGPSGKPAERRLAAQTEDHPISYKDFEGIIPEGEYGGGEVIIWDQGSWVNITRDKYGKAVDPATAIRNGKIEIFFEGAKIKGGYVFVRIGGKIEDADRKDWLMIKKKDKYANLLPSDLEKVGESVVSGRTIYDLQKAGHAD